MGEVRGVLLDVDGTLVDSNDAHAQAWVRRWREHGVNVPFERVRPLIGMGGDKLLPEVARPRRGAARGKQITKRRGEIFREADLPQAAAVPRRAGAAARMKARGAAAGGREFGQGGRAGRAAERRGADELIDARRRRDDAEGSKPDPDIVARGAGADRAAGGRGAAAGRHAV